MKKKLRRCEDILLDMEPLLEELAFDHDLQHGSIIYEIKEWLDVHAPYNKEVYTGKKPDQPIFYYGPKGVVIDELGNVWPIKQYLNLIKGKK